MSFAWSYVVRTRIRLEADVLGRVLFRQIMA